MTLLRSIAAALIGAALTATSASAATVRVEQWSTYLGTSLAAYDAHAAANAPDYVAYVDYIDFSDDLPGFNGNLDGAMPWPGAVQTGQSGRTAPVNQNFFARLTTRLSVAVAGTYTFRTSNDDGVFVRVADTLVINDPSHHGERVFTGSTFLDPGLHDIEIIFFENGGAASLEFSFRSDTSGYLFTGNEDLALAAPIPLPASVLLLLAGLGGLGLTAARRRPA